ncbi:MAG: hypothetical protein R3C05_00585 [Pirellulaceae bacterium]
MSLRVKCPCGQVLSAPDNAAGKRVRCPKCQALLQVPAPAPMVAELFEPGPFESQTFDAEPFASAGDGFDDLPQQNAPAPSYYQSAAGSHPKRAYRGIFVGLAIAIGVLGLISIGAWLAWNFAAPYVADAMKGDEMEFEPLSEVSGEASTSGLPVGVDGSDALAGGDASLNAPAAPLQGRNATETAMLELANRFVTFANANKHKEAVGMIDAKMFHSRLYSSKGSYEAMKKDIPAGKLLSNFANYALDGETNDGKRHWKVIGLSKYDGTPGVILRYYVDPETARGVLESDSMYDRLMPLVTYPEFKQAAEGAFAKLNLEASHFDRYRLDSHAIHNAFPQRAGYMMLVIDCQEAAPRLVDLVNVLGDAPLSRTGALVFLDDYHTFGGFGERETYGTQPITATIFGVTPQSGAIVWSSNDKDGERRAKEKAAAAQEAIERLMPYRLPLLIGAARQNSPNLEAELAAFRQDFPNDFRFDMGLVFSLMSSSKPKFNAASDKLVNDARNPCSRDGKTRSSCMSKGSMRLKTVAPTKPSSSFSNAPKWALKPRSFTNSAFWRPSRRPISPAWSPPRRLGELLEARCWTSRQSGARLVEIPLGEI